MRIILFLLLSCAAVEAQFSVGNPFYVAAYHRTVSGGGGGGGGYDPNTDANAVRWWRAEGTTGTNANNGAVTNWVERKGGIPWTNLTSIAAGPIISNNFVNGKAALRGFGTNFLRQDFGNFSGLTASHWFIVLKSTYDDGTSNPGFCRYIGDNGQSWYYPFLDNNIYNGLGSTTRHNGDPSTSLDAWRLLEVVSISGEWTLYLDGTQQFTDASNSVGWGAGDIYLLFGIDVSEPAIGNWDGYIAEIVVRDTRATGSTLTDIRTYFDTQYNLAY